MKRIENDCVGCPQGCINCGRKEAVYYYCDECGECDTLYEYDGQELCANCLIDKFKIVEGSD